MIQQIQDDLKQAIKQGDKLRRSVLRLLLASIKNEEIARRGPLDEAGILSVIAKEARKRRESIEAFKQGNREDLVMQEEAELVILLGYLPEQISRDEIVAEARKVIGEVEARGVGDKGKVMSQLMARLKGRADGREISSVVSELLSSV